MAKMSIFLFFAVQVVVPLKMNGFFLKVDALKLARHCMSKWLITVEDFSIIFDKSKCGNDNQIKFLWKRLDFYSTQSPSKYYEILKEILKGYQAQSAEYKLSLKFEELEKCPNQCPLLKGELICKGRSFTEA